MKQTKPMALLLSLMLIVLVGCRGGAQIYNVKDAPIATATGKAVEIDQVTKAIIDAGTGLKWSMAVVKPGLIVGTLNVRAHQAVVDIAYDTKTYNITYKDSANLKYDAESKTIHKNYQGWIHNLDNAIKNRLTMAGS